MNISRGKDKLDNAVRRSGCIYLFQRQMESVHHCLDLAFCISFFSRKADNKENFLLLLTVIELVQQIKWYNILGTKSIVDALFCLAWSTGWILPFIADKLFAEKFSGSFMISLVFPSVFTMLEIVRSFTPTGAYSAMAYSQGPFRLLTQIVSVIGSYGLSFLIFWFASVIER